MVGLEGLSESEQMVLEICRMLQEDYLQQNAFHDVDCFCQVAKQYRILKLLLLFYGKACSFSKPENRWSVFWRARSEQNYPE
ncbi:MAG: hypothetical protein GY801_21995 [bacterium]|nr:hypothetical protein [bacterium]